MPLARPKQKAKISPYAHQLHTGGLARPVRRLLRVPPVAACVGSCDRIGLSKMESCEPKAAVKPLVKSFGCAASAINYISNKTRID